MLVLRLVTLALLGCILGMLVSLSRPPHVARTFPHHHHAMRESPQVRIVDVAAGVDAMQLAVMLVGDARDRIAAIDDVPVPSTVAAVEYLRAHPPKSGDYVDVTLSSHHGDRRVLVLMH
ncbi:MAG TPA: hypothetical protein VGM88_07585 [Kofleriaceae bacterium]|jgi:hypothetical protein